MHLTRHDVAFIGVKLLAVYMALQAIGIMGLQLINFLGWPEGHFPLITVIFPVILITIPILLWLCANKLANLIATSPAKASTSGADARDLEASLLAAVGVFIVITTLPQLMIWLLGYIASFHQAQSPIAGLVQEHTSLLAGMIPLAKTVLALMLIFSAKNVASFFRKLRR